MIATVRKPQRGVSLIEALVALLVMAFGILGVVGMHASLRGNADISKQRSEAVRIAQESIEQWRGYSVLPTTAGQVAYADIVDTAAAAVSGYTTNTAYSLVRSVADAQAGGAIAPRMRTVVAEVSWLDRTGLTQRVSLNTNIAGVSPELAGSLGIPAEGAPTQQAAGRHATIPVAAVDQGNGTSIFSPPGSGGSVNWTFNNVTGVITRICSPACVDISAFLLAGYVGFSLGSTPPTGANAEHPSSPTPLSPDNVAVSVALTAPSTTTLACFKEDFPTYVAYYCAVPVTTTVPVHWSGQSLVSGISISSVMGDVAVDHYKVCRYTPGRNEDVNGDSVADGDKPLNGNIDHPLTYNNVIGPLTNQNFLVIRAGDGSSTPFDCPGDDTTTPLFSGNTWRHQPHP